MTDLRKKPQWAGRMDLALHSLQNADEYVLIAVQDGVVETYSAVTLEHRETMKRHMEGVALGVAEGRKFL